MARRPFRLSSHRPCTSLRLAKPHTLTEVTTSSLTRLLSTIFLFVSPQALLCASSFVRAQGSRRVAVALIAVLLRPLSKEDPTTPYPYVEQVCTLDHSLGTADGER